jgi:glyoxylate utilization-related uncharacterized protein
VEYLHGNFKPPEDYTYLERNTTFHSVLLPNDWIFDLTLKAHRYGGHRAYMHTFLCLEHNLLALSPRATYHLLHPSLENDYNTIPSEHP